MKKNESGFGAVEIILALMLLIILGVVGWFVYQSHDKTSSANADSSTTIKTTSTKTQTPLTCSSLLNSTFKSVDKHEAGLGSNGVVMGYWSVYFKDTTFSWSHSDVGEKGEFTCKDGVVIAKLFDRTLTVQTGSKNQTMVWDGIIYKKEK